jgi:hypothetical protein
VRAAGCQCGQGLGAADKKRAATSAAQVHREETPRKGSGVSDAARLLIRCSAKRIKQKNAIKDDFFHNSHQTAFLIKDLNKAGDREENAAPQQMGALANGI